MNESWQHTLMCELLTHCCMPVSPRKSSRLCFPCPPVHLHAELRLLRLSPSPLIPPPPLMCRLCQLLGFPSYKPPCPAGSDGRAPPDSIALIPPSFGPRLPSPAPSRGHSVHGRQGSAAEGPGLSARGHRWQVHPAEVHHQEAGLPAGLRRAGLRPGRQAASTFALQGRPGEVRREEGEAEGGLLPLLREEGPAAASLRLAVGPISQHGFERRHSGRRRRVSRPPGEAGHPKPAAQGGGAGRRSRRPLLPG